MWKVPGNRWLVFLANMCWGPVDDLPALPGSEMEKQDQVLISSLATEEM